MFKIIFALILACLVGYWSGSEKSLFGVPLVELYGLIGELFLNSLSLVVVPLVASSIILGAARMGGDDSMGKLGIKTFASFILITTLGVLVGYAVVTTLSPGMVETQTVLSSQTLDLPLHSKMQTLQQFSEGGAFIKFKELILKLLPSNIFAAASQGQMISLILFCMLFGYFSMRIETQASNVMMTFWRALFQIMMKMTQFFMKALPIGVFGLVAKVVATAGLETFQSVAWFSMTVIVALALHAGIVLPFLLRFLAGINPLAFLSAMSPALLTAFSTSSSAAALPVVLESLEKRAGISNRICGFSVPLGTSISLSGSALYECIVVFFVAQFYGVELSISSQILVVVMSIITSFGLAGIPSACLIAVIVILQTIGLPAEGIGLILAAERILDMFRTAVNVFGNSCCAALVAKSEGEIQTASNSLSSQAVTS